MSSTSDTPLTERLRAMKEGMSMWLSMEDMHDFNEVIAQAAALEAPTVVPAEGEPVAMIHNDYDCSVACSMCKAEGGFSTYDDLEWAKFCPNCGRPISEQVDANGNRSPHPLYRSAPDVDRIMEAFDETCDEFDDDLGAPFSQALRSRLSALQGPLLSDPSGSGEEKPVK